jgi:hypothetical protein
MRDIKELGPFIIEKILFETTADPASITPDSIFTESLDSLGVQLTLMDIEDQFMDAGMTIDEDFIMNFFASHPSIQHVTDVVTDVILGNIDIEEAQAEDYVYVKRHDW